MGNDATERLHGEAEAWDTTDITATRSVSWNSIGHFGLSAAREAFGTIDVARWIRERVPARARGVTLGCGDMTAEYPIFVDVGCAAVDAYDLSAESWARFESRVPEPTCPVTFHHGDVNGITLERERYGLCVIQDAIHHIENLERVCWQLNEALTPDGLVYLFDYVGPRFLQFTERQLEIAAPLFRALPEELRRDREGRVRNDLQVTPKDLLSPYEAVRSDEVWAILCRYLKLETGIRFAGLLYPLFEGVAHNFDPDRRQGHALYVRSMYELDRYLCRSGAIEPNFCIAAFRKRT